MRKTSSKFILRLFNKSAQFSNTITNSPLTACVYEADAEIILKSWKFRQLTQNVNWRINYYYKGAYINFVLN